MNKNHKKILVTGGAGYIGSHTIIELISAGYDVVSVDNFSNSSKKSFTRIKNITGVSVKNYTVDIADRNRFFKVLAKEKNVTAVIHFAAYKSVPNSVADPLKYYDNNLGSLCTLLAWCKEKKIKEFVFSSSCAVYGNIQTLPVTEDTPFSKACSPYAMTKQISEEILSDFSKSQDIFRSVALRYFNPAGAHSSGKIGEDTPGIPANLVPIITKTALGILKKPLTVFGTKLDTRDGSCIRDYVHVSDIASAHVQALSFLENAKKPFEVINLGAGKGVTVLELIKIFERISGKTFSYVIGKPRAGDVVAIYSDNKKARKLLKWIPKYTTEDILESAWRWENCISIKK